MKTLSWLFGKKKSETELKEIKKLKKELKKPLKTFEKMFVNLEKKKDILDKIWGKEVFFNDIKARDPIQKINDKLIKSIQETLVMEDFEDRLLKHMLIESATRLHEVSEDLNIQSLHRSYSIDNVEEAKRRSYEVLKFQAYIDQLKVETSKRFDGLRESLNYYIRFLASQSLSIKIDNTRKYEDSLMKEHKYLDKLIYRFKRFTLNILARTKSVLATERKTIYMAKREIEEKNASFIKMGGKEAILMFHGYGDTPDENREMHDYFVSNGYSVFAPRFPGHGTTHDEFFNTNIKQIRRFGQKSLDYFYKQNNNKPVFVTGLSLGGMVALDLASQEENYKKIKGIIPINAFIKAGIQTKFLDKISSKYGARAFEFLLENIGLRHMKKKSINLILQKAKHIATSVNHFQFHNFDRSFEDKLTKDYLERIDMEFKDAIENKKEYRIKRKELEADFRERYRQGKIAAFDIQDITRLLEHEFYNVMTYKGMAQLSRLSRLLQKEMKDIICPVYVIQSEKDKTVDPVSADIIQKSCKNSIKEIVPNTGHILILEKQRFEVFKKIESFIEKISRQEIIDMPGKQNLQNTV